MRREQRSWPDAGSGLDDVLGGDEEWVQSTGAVGAQVDHPRSQRTEDPARCRHRLWGVIETVEEVCDRRDRIAGVLSDGERGVGAAHTEADDRARAEVTVECVDPSTDLARIVTPDPEDADDDGGVGSGAFELGDIIEYAAAVQSRYPQRAETQGVEFARGVADLAPSCPAWVPAPHADPAGRAPKVVDSHPLTLPSFELIGMKPNLHRPRAYLQPIDKKLR